ncbi:glucose 1-dehydrogenase [bacterium]|nr:glucose 1-dehydrogenase [bacterium]
MNENFSLAGKTALITGAGRGLGKAIAAAMADAGANTVLLARSRDALTKAAAELGAAGNTSLAVPFDLTEVDKIPDLFEKIKTEAGKIDILVNCAGTTHRESAVDFSLAEWNRVLAVNLTAPFVLSQQFARACIADKRPGKIINIASLLSEAARPTIPAYTASKGAIKQLTQALAVEWAPNHINVNGIGPGYFSTEMTQPLVENTEFNNWVLQKTPQRRWGKPEDLVGTAVFLASSASDFITGQTIYVDGGWLANL